MAQDVKIANITYSDVPAIEIPKATTGTALFTDTSPTTAVASDVASGKYFFTASGQLTLGSASGGTAAISVVDTTDTAGGTIRTITALDISDTTATAADVAQGKYFYTSSGVKTAGSASGGGTPSATAHTIYFEFSDNTSTTITAYYDSTFISDAITATTPTTYNNKTVTLAQLDNVTWYEPAAIPLNTELIDSTKLTTDSAINSSGEAVSAQWYCATDYTAVDPSMTFSYTGCTWYYIGVYDSSKQFLRSIAIQTDGTQDPGNSNISHGTLSGAKLSGAAYVRITGVYYQGSYVVSLIRTA